MEKKVIEMKLLGLAAYVAVQQFNWALYGDCDDRIDQHLFQHWLVVRCLAQHCTVPVFHLLSLALEGKSDARGGGDRQGDLRERR